MHNHNDRQAILAVTSGAVCLFIGVGQILYAFVALLSVFLVNTLGVALTLGASAIAAVPDKPIEIPYARELAMGIATVTLLFGILCFVIGAFCFYNKQISRPTFASAAVACGILIVLHWANDLDLGILVYCLAAFWFMLIALIDWVLSRVPQPLNEIESQT